MSRQPEHLDLVGTIIKVNDPVVFPQGTRGLMAGRVHHLTPKMLCVAYGTKRGESKKLLYPNDVMIIQEDAMMMYLLRKQ